MTIEDLAAKAISVLNSQAQYFKTRRLGDLIESKKLERSLRQECDKILGVQKGLFLNGD